MNASQVHACLIRTSELTEIYIMSHMCAPSTAYNDDGVGHEPRDTYWSYTNTNTLWVRICLIRTSDMTGWCSFCYLIRNSLVALLEALFTIYSNKDHITRMCTYMHLTWQTLTMASGVRPATRFSIWQFPLKMLHPKNPPNPETQISWYKFRLFLFLHFILYCEIPRNLSFSIWWILGV